MNYKAPYSISTFFSSYLPHITTSSPKRQKVWWLKAQVYNLSDLDTNLEFISCYVRVDVCKVT